MGCQMSNELLKILIKRDGMSEAEAKELIEEAKKEVSEGSDPEEVLADYFGLEPDYIFDLLD